MGDRVAGESVEDKHVWQPLRKWWRPHRLFNQDFGQPLIHDPGDQVWGRGGDLLQRGWWSSGRPWPECTSSPLIVPMHAGSRYGPPPPPSSGQAEQYKWSVVLDVAHFAPSEISISTAGEALVITGKHEERSDDHGFIARCFTRKYRLPIGVDLSKITAILTGDGLLYLEAPLTEFTAPADVVIPIQVERGVGEPPQHDVGGEQGEPEDQEKEAQGEVAEESPSSSATGDGEGNPENPPEPIEHHEVHGESPESPGSSPPEEAGSAQPETPGEAAVEDTQMEQPKEGENQDTTSQEAPAVPTE